MAEFIGPVVDWVIATLEARLPLILAAAELEPFVEYRRSWTGVGSNWPSLAVMARTTDFDTEGSGRHSLNRLTVKFGVNGDDPDQVTTDSMAYMKAIDDALAAAVDAWDSAMSRVFVGTHDYGPLYEKGGGFARFPEMHLEVELYEA